MDQYDNLIMSSTTTNIITTTLCSATNIIIQNSSNLPFLTHIVADIQCTKG
ncbi:hypothetical protein HanXRQr2_Chr01g0013141 [Helianthus annuus]|uniref:Uncharacterized protein n=1 Tax=Helianthus annuus TaxID=4232 RepID=A0A9K3JVH5_HELAN|nr:hypothetical protein HanXRQr2_Chr01g0013141 [Helianthus annuus]